MPQYDVYVNPQRASRAFVPYVLDVQSNLIDCLSTRLVMPLSRIGAAQRYLPVNLCPIVLVEDEKLTIQPHLAAPVAASALKNPVLNLQSQASEITAALDTVISGV
jgi:toxin CcdB